MWKLLLHPRMCLDCICFSPLAGIRYVETLWKLVYFLGVHCPVSVPLRGLDMWKPDNHTKKLQFIVSVPLRGLDMWKPRRLKHNLGAESRDDFGGPLKKPYFRLRVKRQLKLMKR